MYVCMYVCMYVRLYMQIRPHHGHYLSLHPGPLISAVLLGRIDGSVWYHLPIGCTLEGILSSNQPTNSKRPSMPLIPIYRVVFLPEHNL